MLMHPALVLLSPHRFNSISLASILPFFPSSHLSPTPPPRKVGHLTSSVRVRGGMWRKGGREEGDLPLTEFVSFVELGTEEWILPHRRLVDVLYELEQVAVQRDLLLVHRRHRLAEPRPDLVRVGPLGCVGRGV